MTPEALLPEVTPAPPHPFTHTHTLPWPQPYTEGPPPTTEPSAGSSHPAQLSGPADQEKRGEGLKSLCHGPGLPPSGEVAQPFQAGAGVPKASPGGLMRDPDPPTLHSLPLLEPPPPQAKVDPEQLILKRYFSFSRLS